VCDKGNQASMLGRHTSNVGQQESYRRRAFQSDKGIAKAASMREETMAGNMSCQHILDQRENKWYALH